MPVGERPADVVPPRFGYPAHVSLATWLGDLCRRLLALGPGRPLCDRCKWDYGDACRRPERPNARRCPDFSRR
jgi:hypothetical protein